MADKKKWSDVKAVLDDPSVPAGQKSALISSWLRENPPPPPFLADQEPDDIKQKRQEADKYARAFNANPLFAGQSLDEAYDKAKKSGDQNSYNEDQEKKAVDEGKTKLDATQPPAAESSTGTKTSDEIFDAAAPALKLFETFGSLLAKIPADCRGNTRALDLDKDIRQPFDEQRGISFKDFADDAAHFKRGSETVDRTEQDTGSQLGTLFRTWTGAGADAASDTYNEKIQPKAAKLSQTLGNASEATLHTATTVFQLCKGKADAVIGMYTDVVGKADYTLAQKVVAVANGEHGSKEDLAEIAGWMDLNFGTNLVKTLNDQGCCDGDEIKKHGQDLAKQWVQNQFNPDMWDRLYQGFAKTCKDTKDLVDQAYDALDKVMGSVRNEFEGVTLPGGSGTGGAGTGGTGGGSGAGGSGGGSGSGSGSGTGGSGGGSGTGGAGAGIPGSGSGSDGSGTGSGSGAGSGSGGSGSGGGSASGSTTPPPIPDVDTPSGAGSAGGSGSSGDSSGGQDTADAEAAKQKAAAEAEAAKQKASDALKSLDGPPIQTESGAGASGSSGSGSGAGTPPPIPDVDTPSGAGSPGGQDAAAEAAKQKAADALKSLDGDPIKTESGAGAGLGDTPSSGGAGLGGGSGGSGDQEAAVEAAKQKAADALKSLDGDPIKTESGEGLGDSGTDDGKGAAEDADAEAKKKAEEALHGLDGDKDGKPDGLLGEDGDEPDTLKVKQGDKTFEMTEPDHDGKMDIKVGDGPGDPKDFKLDWSADGPQGTDDDGCHHPGPDGKIHIEDGDLKITAERPDGPDGPTVVTVDDGSGTPTSYTLGEDDKPSDALGGTPEKRDDDLPAHRGTLDDLGTGKDGSGAHHSPDGSHGGDGAGSHGGGAGSDGAGSHHGGTGAAGFGGGGHGGPSTAGFDPSGAGLGDTPTSGGAHTGVGLAQSQPAAAFAPAGATAGPGGQSMSGMPGMGAMGGGAHGGGGGGDTERRSSAYRIDGAVFDNLGEPGRRIIGSLNDDEDPASARTW